MNKKILEETIELAAKKTQERLSQDPEWTKKRYTHLHNLIIAFSVGILRADLWFKNYDIPSNFSDVLNHLAIKINNKWDLDIPVVELSLLEIEDLYREAMADNSHFKQWTSVKEGEPNIQIGSAFDSLGVERSSMDSDAIIRNASIFLRDERRKRDQFDAEFANRLSNRLG